MAVASAFLSQVSISPGSTQGSNLGTGGPRRGLRGWGTSQSSKYGSVSAKPQGLGAKQGIARSSRLPGVCFFANGGPWFI